MESLDRAIVLARGIAILGFLLLIGSLAGEKLSWWGPESRVVSLAGLLLAVLGTGTSILLWNGRAHAAPDPGSATPARTTIDPIDAKLDLAHGKLDLANARLDLTNARLGDLHDDLGAKLDRQTDILLELRDKLSP